MLSNEEVYTRLTRHFIALRLDWEQGYHFKDRFGFILGTGDQMILDPAGAIVRPAQPDKDGRPTVLYGRHGRDTTGDVLETILTRYPGHPEADLLKIDWFFWTTKASRRPGGSYPASPQAIAGFARLPMATVRGPIPDALRDPEFLRHHVRQFIWVRGPEDAPPQILVDRVKDGLPEGIPTRLAALDPAGLTPQALGEALDSAWLTYMKDRPLVARGYLDNPHGKWMRSLREQMIFEDEEVRRRARAGTLAPPGRMPSQETPRAP